MAAERIPLFPLDVVLFPGMPLPLHIFEPRYKLMIRHCIQHHAEFGVVLARKDNIVRTGCTAEVLKVVREYPDGRMDILTAGQTLFRILELFDEKPFFEAAIEFLDESAGDDPPEPPAELLSLYQQFYRLAYGRPPEPPAAPADSPFSFQVATVLPLELEFKQLILETHSEVERQSHLLAHLQKRLPELARVQTLRKRAGGNGHGAA